MNYEKIGLFIKTLREKRDLSQNDLALKLHISRQAISKWERGITIPDASTLVLLSEMFDVSINEILAGTYLTHASEVDAITLEVLEDKQRLKEIIHKFVVAFIILLLMFLTYYFMNGYYSFRVYMVNGKYEEADLFDGMLVQADNELYLKLLKLNDHVKLENLKLYYIKDKKEVVFYENHKDTELVNFYGVKTTISRKNMNALKKGLYVEFNGEKIKLDIDSEYVGEIKDVVVTDGPHNTDSIDKNLIEILDRKYPSVENGYLYDNGEYKVLYHKKLKLITLEMGDEEYLYDLESKTLYYKNLEESTYVTHKDGCLGYCLNSEEKSSTFWRVLNETIFN